MVEFRETNNNISLEEIKKFEMDNNLELTEKYKEFLLKCNGGKVKPNVFLISKEQGESVLSIFFGIGDMYSNLADYIDIFEFRLPENFLPIGLDSGGNAICLGTKTPYRDHIYFWDHEQESETPDDMRNMYFLASDIDEFLNMLYEDDE
ncbi:SMI1/KNR4 family protein [Bacillus sp. A301a_S52]|nr:SMI1/KNR4 family protein [Bacillus sp. A301a_S52]